MIPLTSIQLGSDFLLLLMSVFMSLCPHLYPDVTIQKSVGLPNCSLSPRKAGRIFGSSQSADRCSIHASVSTVTAGFHMLTSMDTSINERSNGTLWLGLSFKEPRMRTDLY